jgi:hypothetical protein
MEEEIKILKVDLNATKINFEKMQIEKEKTIEEWYYKFNKMESSMLEKTRK